MKKIYYIFFLFLFFSPSILFANMNNDDKSFHSVNNWLEVYCTPSLSLYNNANGFLINGGIRSNLGYLNSNSEDGSFFDSIVIGLRGSYESISKDDIIVRSNCLYLESGYTYNIYFGLISLKILPLINAGVVKSYWEDSDVVGFDGYGFVLEPHLTVEIPLNFFKNLLIGFDAGYKVQFIDPTRKNIMLGFITCYQF